MENAKRLIILFIVSFLKTIVEIQVLYYAHLLYLLSKKDNMFTLMVYNFFEHSYRLSLAVYFELQYKDMANKSSICYVLLLIKCDKHVCHLYVFKFDIYEPSQHSECNKVILTYRHAALNYFKHYCTPLVFRWCQTETQWIYFISTFATVFWKVLEHTKKVNDAFHVVGLNRVYTVFNTISSWKIWRVIASY